MGSSPRSPNGHTSEKILTGIGILLFTGAIGKSAQFPLHVWLPDAMEGPTPVSALIHAATMVTAGIYLVARSNPIFMQAPDAMLVVAVVGCFTAFLGASIATTQNDIKRVVAYSTVSQLGYMALALGVGAWVTAIFHLVAHAFFKACLFLGSGSVIHGMHEEQNIQKMGGLRKFMPVTFGTFLIASLANAGVFPLAGFWSKDEIITGAWESSIFPRFGDLLTVVALITALITAYYMGRLVFLTFFGKPRYDEAHVHPHESPCHHDDPAGHPGRGHDCVRGRRLSAGCGRASTTSSSRFLRPDRRTRPRSVAEGEVHEEEASEDGRRGRGS